MRTNQITVDYWPRGIYQDYQSPAAGIKRPFEPTRYYQLTSSSEDRLHRYINSTAGNPRWVHHVATTPGWTAHYG